MLFFALELRERSQLLACPMLDVFFLLKNQKLGSRSPCGKSKELKLRVEISQAMGLVL